MTFVLAGSFDPFTLGHKDIVDRFNYFGDVEILISTNPNKKYVFSIEQRVKIISLSFDTYHKITILNQGCSVASYVKSIDGILIRGLRNSSDFEYEQNMYWINNKISNVETIFVMSKLEKIICSSSAVRELLKLDCDLSEYLNKDVIDYIKSIKISLS